jgi:hypothetical protein
VARILKADKPQAELVQPIGVVPSTGTRAQADSLTPLVNFASGMTDTFIKKLKEQKSNQDTSYVSNVMFSEHRWLKDEQSVFESDPDQAYKTLETRRSVILGNAAKELGQDSAHYASIENTLLNLHGRHLDNAVTVRKLADQNEAFNDSVTLLEVLTDDYSQLVHDGGFVAFRSLDMELLEVERTLTQFIAYGSLHELSAGRSGQTAADVVMENLDRMKNTLMRVALTNEILQRFRGETPKIIGVTQVGNAIVGYTAEGRPIIQGESDEGVYYFSEQSITVQDPKLPGVWTNIPTVYDGLIVSDEEAIERAINANGFDSETNRKLSGFDTEEDASRAAAARSSMVEPAVSRVAAEEFIQQFIDNPESIGAEFGLSLLDRTAAAKLAETRLASILGIADLKKEVLAKQLKLYRADQVLPYSDLLLKIKTDTNFGPAQIEIAIAGLYDFKLDTEVYTQKLSEAMRVYRAVTVERAEKAAATENSILTDEDKRTANIQESLREGELQKYLFGLTAAGEDPELPFPSYADMDELMDKLRAAAYPNFKKDIKRLWTGYYTALGKRTKSHNVEQGIRIEFAKNRRLTDTPVNRAFVTKLARERYDWVTRGADGQPIPVDPSQVIENIPKITALAKTYGLVDDDAVNYLKAGLNNFKNASELLARMSLWTDLELNLVPDTLLGRFSQKEVAFYSQMFTVIKSGGSPLEAQKLVLDRITNPDKATSDRKYLDMFNTVDLSEYLATDDLFQKAIERSAGSNWFTKMMRDKLGIGPEVTPEMMVLGSKMLGLVAKYYDDPDKATEHVAKLMLTRFGSSIFSQNEGAMSRPPEMFHTDALGSVHYIKQQIHEVFEELRKTALQEDVDQWPGLDEIFDGMGENIYLVEDKSSKARAKPSYNIWFKLEDRWEYLTDKGGTNPFKFLPDAATSRRAMERMNIVRHMKKVQLEFEATDESSFFKDLKPGWMDTLDVETKMLVLDASRWLKRGDTGAFIETVGSLIKVIEQTSKAYRTSKPVAVPYYKKKADKK